MAPDSLERENQLPSWQLPHGVTRGEWDYFHSIPIASDYDDYFAHNRLFEFDAQILHDFLPAPTKRSVVADLGCGTGRALLPLVQRGFHGLAIDLSEHMLQIVQEKARQENLSLDCLRANLVELDAVRDNSIDHAISLFSTLGMICGKRHRQRSLDHVRRILKPGGTFIIHVHNLWFNLFDPGGPWWLLRNLIQSTFSRDIERGDKSFSYRGIPQMFLHVFTQREIVTALRSAGLKPWRIIPLDVRRFRRLKNPWLFGRFRANGWIIVCH